MRKLAKIRATDQAHNLLSKQISPGDLVIDATTGNGYDTCFLAEKVGKQGTVIGFDISPVAIKQTQLLFQKLSLESTLSLHNKSHELMSQVIPNNLAGNISAVMFNLGYLPGSNKTLITTKNSTLIALDQSLSLLKLGGVITIISYPGHSGGPEENDSVLRWADQLPPQHFNSTRILPENNGGPILSVVTKRPLPSPPIK